MMKRLTLGRFTAVSAVAGITVAAALAFFPGAIGANASSPAVSAVSAPTAPAQFRRQIGTITESTFLEASVPAAGTYVIEYDVTGTASYGTYVNGVELGNVGGGTGVYQTKPQHLPAGGVLVQSLVTGEATAKVSIVGVAPTAPPQFRRQIGTITESAFLEASVPRAGTYVIEYDVTGTASYGTYVNGVELGKVGGGAGVYQTKPQHLPAGGVLVQSVVTGEATAKVSIVGVS